MPRSRQMPQPRGFVRPRALVAAPQARLALPEAGGTQCGPQWRGWTPAGACAFRPAAGGWGSAWAREPLQDPVSLLATPGPSAPHRLCWGPCNVGRPQTRLARGGCSGRRPPRVPFTSASFWGPQSGFKRLKCRPDADSGPLPLSGLAQTGVGTEARVLGSWGGNATVDASRRPAVSAVEDQ